MTFNICLINNCNNGKFLKSCLGSVIAQSTPFDQIIVVDDGSNDNSLLILEKFKSTETNLIVLEKKNGGQVSAFNFAKDYIVDDSQVFFLDADDTYPGNYLESVLIAMGQKKWDFAYCDHHIFDHSLLMPLISAKKTNDANIVFSSTSAIARSRHCWIGNLTSSISISGLLFRKIFPYPAERHETLFADDIAIFASSILGTQKIYLPSIAINWRSHGSNNSKKLYSSEQINSRNNSINKLFNFYCQQYKIPRYPSFVEFSKELRLLGPGWRMRLGFPGAMKMFNRLIRQRLNSYFLG